MSLIMILNNVNPRPIDSAMVVGSILPLFGNVEGVGANVGVGDDTASVGLGFTAVVGEGVSFGVAEGAPVVVGLGVTEAPVVGVGAAPVPLTVIVAPTVFVQSIISVTR
jgi:hypothetical protein